MVCVAARLSYAPPSMATPRALPVLPLRDIVVFPHMLSQLFVGRERSILALEAAAVSDKEVFLVVQRSAKINDPAPEDLHTVGTIGFVSQMLRLPDGTVKVQVEGRRRARLVELSKTDPYFLAEVLPIDEKDPEGLEIDALVRSLQAAFEAYAKLHKKIEPEVLITLGAIDGPAHVADAILAHMPSVKLSDRQAMLESFDPKARLSRLLELLEAEIEILQVEKKIRSRVKRQMERTQKEYYLNEQMQAIQKELGEGRDEAKTELQELEDLIQKKQLSKEARERCDKELRKLKMMHPTSAEATVVRNYLDWILCLPWGETSTEELDLEKAEAVLEEDHHGLAKIKERILEHLAVEALTKENKGPILCFVGPPGVGKTSLGRSIARATGRAFVRLSLGGVRDEAEIRGHRRTYIGAMPGKIIQSLKRAKTMAPLFLLDEVDKMSSDFRGDPASALLEVLDPEQNSTFADHYLDLDFDLSKILFVTTANSLSGIPLPLADRMETIELSGYTDDEKLHIARRYLLPRQLEESGLGRHEISMTDAALAEIRDRYTREAGVRTLEREIGGVCRKIARRVLKGGLAGPLVVDAKDVEPLLGPPRFRSGKAEERSEIGLTQGLSVTSYGGELLACEVSIVRGKGKLHITGKLGDVMKESAQAAVSYVRSRSDELGIPDGYFGKHDVHIHFPEGAIPKDGPSAGITIATSLVSAVKGIPVRRDVAMTGEITLRGRVLPIGGLKEKLLAAARAGVTHALIPRDNEKDLADVPGRVLAEIEILSVEHADDVLRAALLVRDPDVLLPRARSVRRFVAGRLVEDSTDPSETRPLS